MGGYPRQCTPTLCWDCAKATGYCRWSSELKPIKGWKVTHTVKENSYYTTRSFIVHECPEFMRDAIGGGLKRYKEKENDTMSEDIKLHA